MKEKERGFVNLATDANGNTATATQAVTVNLVDTVPSVITVPADVSVSTNISQATVDIGIASATDNVDGMVAVTNNTPATFPIGLSFNQVEGLLVWS